MEVVITKSITNCEECPFHKSEKVYTPDPWDNVRKITCTKLDKVVHSYLDWYDKSDVPQICPFNNKGES